MLANRTRWIWEPPMNISEPAVTAPAQPAGVEALPRVLAAMKAAARQAGIPTYDERVASLDKLERALLKNKDGIAKAIASDFGHRSRHETFVADVFVVLGSIKHTRSHLRDWMEAEDRETSFVFMPATCKVVYQPIGVVGIIAPWNYPVQLALAPLVSALAAGNRALIKPSELTPRTAEKIAEIVSQVLPGDHVAVVCGGPDIGETFARLPFDHLIFTGSALVGQKVLRAASENLVPVTLELGGKCPAIVGVEAGARTAAQRIMAGKTFNAGQTCLAPDYALIPAPMKDAFVQRCRQAVTELYPTLAHNPDYTTIVSEARYERLLRLIDDA